MKISFEKYAKSKPISLIVNHNGEIPESFITDYCKAIICSNGFCGTCNDCLKINDKEYADILYVDEQTKKDELDEIVARLYMGSIEANGYKMVVFKNTHLISSININSILKTIEEPPVNTHFLFLTYNVDKVIDTIKSRSMLVHMHFDKNDDSNDLLEMTPECLLNIHNIFKELKVVDIKREVIKLLKKHKFNNEQIIIETISTASTNINKNLFLDKLSVLLLEGK